MFFTGVTTTNGSSALIAKGPDEDKIKEILNRTGYKLDVTTGQRKYGGPPPNWEGDPPASGCEVSIQQIFREIFRENDVFIIWILTSVFSEIKFIPLVPSSFPTKKGI